MAKIEGGKVLIYSQWFAFEIPATEMDPAFDDWDEAAHEAAIGWRKVVPQESGEYGQAVRWTNPEDGVKLIKLLADSNPPAIIHPSIFDIVTKKLPESEFRVFPGDKTVVGIYSQGVLIGGTAQMKL